MAKIPEVLIVDQDAAARFELKRLIKQGQFELAGEASLGTEAVSLASELKPDVIMCGIGEPAERSLQTIEALLDVASETPLIAYGSQGELDTIRKAMLAGARDFIVMPGDAERVTGSILSVLESEERKRLRQTGQTRAMGPRGLVLTVFGAKGGIGKTTLAVNLGVALAQARQSAVLVDADTGFGDVAAMLDIKAETTVVDLTRTIDRIDADKLSEQLAQHESGLRVLPGPPDPFLWRGVEAARFRKVVDALAKRFDIVIIDTPPALTDITLSALEESTLVLWLTSPDFASINSSLRGLAGLRQMSYPEGRIKLMLNAASPEDGMRPAKIEQALGWRFFWLLPYDRELRASSQIGRPLVSTKPTSNAARSILQLAYALTGNGFHSKAKTPLLRRLGDQFSGVVSGRR